jgi:hypothetical protein
VIEELEKTPYAFQEVIQLNEKVLKRRGGG